MKIESNIRSLLNTTGKVVVPDLGTFTSATASAEVTESGGVIAPPQAKISFTEDTTDSKGYSLTDYLVASGQMSESDAALEVEAFVKGVLNTIEASGTAGIGSMGHFQKSSGSLEFVSNESTAMKGDSFGLPKLSARPLVPVAVTDNKSQPTGGNDGLLLKAILIPLVLFAVILVFFLINEDAKKALFSYFGSDEPAITTPIKNDGNDLADSKTDDPVDKPDDGGNTDDPASKDDGNTKTSDAKIGDEKPADDKPKETPKADDSKTTTVTTNTARFYIIIGSFQNDQAAQKAVNKCKKLGYPNAKVLKMNSKIRVSIEDHSDRATAMTKSKKIGKDYPGAWVLAN